MSLLNYANFMPTLCQQLHPIETKIIFESPIEESTFIEEDILEKLNKRQRQAVKYLTINKTITNKRYCFICKTDRATAFRDLKELEDKEVILRKGRGRSLHYVLCEANNSKEVKK